MPKISVIIPVYNVEEYLRKCLDSVINQTFTDIEIICIEDCSTDNSAKILYEYAEKDNRIVLLQNSKNSGLSFSRNRGIEIAKGEYIQFVDSDDYITHDSLEKLYKIASQNDLDLLKTQIRVCDCDSHQYPSDIIGNIYTGQELLSEFISHHQSLGEVNAAFTCFLKTSFVQQNSLRFFNGIYFEDVLFAFDVYACANKSMCINEKTYIYQFRGDSISHSAVSSEHMRSYIVMLEQLAQKCTRSNYSNDFLMTAMTFYCRMFDHRVMRFNTKNFNDYIKNWPEETAKAFHLIYDFKKFYQLILDNIELLNNSRVFIYGAGIEARQYISALNSYDIPISGVLVTNISSNRKTFFGHILQSVNDIKIDAENDVIILAVSEMYIHEILQILQKKNIRNILYKMI